MNHTTSLFAIILLSFTFGFAQNDTISKASPSYIYSINAGVISALPEQNGINVGFNAGLDLGFHSEWFLYLSTMRRKREFDGFIFGPLPSNKLVRLENYSLMFGQKEYLTNDLYLYYSAGLSGGRGVYRGEIIDTIGSFFPTYVIEYDTFSYIGVPINIGVMCFSPDPLGVSLELYINLHKHPDYGIMLKFHLGRLRQRKKSYHNL